MWIKAMSPSSLIVHAVSLPSQKRACNHTIVLKEYVHSSLPVTCKVCLRFLNSWSAYDGELAALLVEDSRKMEQKIHHQPDRVTL